MLWNPNPSPSKTGGENYQALQPVTSGGETYLYLDARTQNAYKSILNWSRERPDEIEAIFKDFLVFLFLTFPRKGIIDLIEASKDFYGYYLEAQNYVPSKQSEVTTVKLKIKDVYIG